MEECVKCGKSKEYTELFNAIDGNEIIKACESCAGIENLIIIDKPATNQLDKSQKPYTVYERLARMAKLPNSYSPERFNKIQPKKDEISLDSLRKKTSEMKIIQPAQQKPELKIELIENFHWHIQRARRKLGMTQKKLGETIGESEETIKIIEAGQLPKNAIRVINNLEVYLNISIQKNKAKLFESNHESEMPARILNFDKKTVENLKIHDLQKMKEMREKAEKIEKEKINKALEELEENAEEKPDLEFEEYEDEEE